jgi:hypothetical protein
MSSVVVQKWTHGTNWRQGHVLTPEAAAHFRLVNAASPQSTCVVVVSHDCDLAIADLTVEGFAEVIVGRLVDRQDGNFAWAKSPRTLHYPVRCDGSIVHVELVATAKAQIPKSELAQFEPNSRMELDGQTLEVIRDWLSARYRRAAFPDGFVDRMRRTKADSKLAKALEEHGSVISFVYFDLDEGLSLERAEGVPYMLRIVLVFNPGDDPDATADAADAAAAAVEKAVTSRLPETDSAIRLEACMAISEDDITVSQARELRIWRLEYMTHRAETDQLGALDR